VARQAARAEDEERAGRRGGRARAANALRTRVQACALLAAHALDHLPHCLAGFGHQHRAHADLVDRVADHALDFFRGGGAAPGQVAHFGGDEREAAPLLAGPGRLHGRVQGQDIGLEGDAVDDGDDVHHLARGRLDRAHGVDHLGHDLAAAQRHFGGRDRHLVGLARIVGILAPGRGQFFHRGRRFFQRAGLLFGTCRQDGVALADLVAGPGDEGIEAGGDRRQFVRAAHLQAGREVGLAAGQVRHRGGQRTHRADQPEQRGDHHGGSQQRAGHRQSANTLRVRAPGPPRPHAGS
jgi:hypothetical protein